MVLELDSSFGGEVFLFGAGWCEGTEFWKSG